MLIRTLCRLQGGATPWGKVAKHPSKEHAPGFLSSTVLEGIVFEVTSCFGDSYFFMVKIILIKKMGEEESSTRPHWRKPSIEGSKWMRNQ